MPVFDLDAWVARSRAIDLAEIDWEAVPHHPVAPEIIRTLHYMQDIESHTIVYTRSLLATRAIADPEVATFLACWLYEETFHGLALARFLQAAGRPVGERERPRGSESFPQWLEARLIVDRFWAPVGSGVQPGVEVVFMARYLFGDDEGRAAARKVDDTIRRLPGFATVRLLEAWIERHAEAAVGNGGRNGHGHQ